MKVFTCARCRTKLLYFSRFDAYGCPRCDSWAEEVCGDDACAQCASRPKKPSVGRVVLDCRAA